MITLSDILNIADYEMQRPEYRKRIIDAKRHRRVQVGPYMTFVFENRATVLFQIQEMVRTERLVHDKDIQHEIDTYNRLLPSRNELSATLLIDITEAEKIRPILDSLIGLPRKSVYLVIGEKEIEATFDEEQSEEASPTMLGRISAVQYIRWKLNDQKVERLRFGQADVSLLIRHPNYLHSTQLTNEQRMAIAKDLSE